MDLDLAMEFTVYEGDFVLCAASYGELYFVYSKVTNDFSKLNHLIRIWSMTRVSWKSMIGRIGLDWIGLDGMGWDGKLPKVPT